jgi:hypothetical protein
VRKWFLLYSRFDAHIDLYCGEVSGNQVMKDYARRRIIEIDHELDLLMIGEMK